jgi:hypothetical protein
MRKTHPMKRLATLIVVTVLALVGAACHDLDNPNTVSSTVKAGDGSRAAQPGWAGTTCDLEWNEWGTVDGRAWVGWRVTDQNPVNNDGCTDVRVCLVYTVPGTDPVQSGTNCGPWRYPQIDGALAGASAWADLDPKDARLEFIANGTFTLTKCHLFNVNSNVDPGGVCPPALPLP